MSEAMSERELEEIEKWNQERKSLFGTAVNPVNLQLLLCARVGPLLSEVRRSHVEVAELKERLAECTDRRGQLAKALGIDELLPWEDVKLELSKWEELEAEVAELREKTKKLEADFWLACEKYDKESEKAYELRKQAEAAHLEVTNLQTENAELRESIKIKRDVINELHRERIALENRYAELREKAGWLESVLRRVEEELCSIFNRNKPGQSTAVASVLDSVRIALSPKQDQEEGK